MGEQKETKGTKRQEADVLGIGKRESGNEEIRVAVRGLATSREAEPPAHGGIVIPHSVRYQGNEPSM